MNNEQVLLNTDDVVCKNCGCAYFIQVFLIKKVSKVVTKQSQDSLIPLSVYRCADCNEQLNFYDETNPLPTIN